jgi:hypothetical protein
MTEQRANHRAGAPVTGLRTREPKEDFSLKRIHFSLKPLPLNPAQRMRPF